MMSISRSTANLDSFCTESNVDKLNRLSKSYSLTTLSKRSRKRSSSSERTFDQDTLASRNKVKVNRKNSSESLRDRTLTRLSRNIERDRNSEQILSKAYRERCKGVMNQTTSRTASKKRDSEVLSGGATRTRLPPISKPGTKQTAPSARARTGKQETVNPAPRPPARSRPNEDPTRRARAGREEPRGKSGRPEEPRGKSGRPEENSRGGKGGRNFIGVVNRTTPARSLAGTVHRAMGVNRGAVSKPVDDVKLNMKYAKVVCEVCKLQIHEKLKRGYTKYKSLEKMKDCERCQKAVIDFDFYQLCVSCAKELQVCARCVTGSTAISGERFVEVVRQGVEEDILSMNDRELSKFAKKHARIGTVEQKIITLENQASDKSAPSSRSSARSRGALSGKSNKSSKQSPSPRQLDAELKAEKSPKHSASKSKKVSKNARSMTSSSSPLVGGESESETCLSSTESDEAYGSGHISSVSEVKTVQSTTKKSKTRVRQNSSEILKQIRSLTNLQITSPTSAQSLIDEIRSLTEMECNDDDEKSLGGGRQKADERKTAGKSGGAKKKRGTPAPSPQPSYTPFSSTSERSDLQEDLELREYMDSPSRTPTLPPIAKTGTVNNEESHSHSQLEPSQVSVDTQQDVREYSPSPPVVTIKTVSKQSSELDGGSGGDSSVESEVENDDDIKCNVAQSDQQTPKKESEVVVEEVINTDTEVEDETIDDESNTVADETESIDEIVERISSESEVAEIGPTELADEVTAVRPVDNEVASIEGSIASSKRTDRHDEKLSERTDTSENSEMIVTSVSDDGYDDAFVEEIVVSDGAEKIQLGKEEVPEVLGTHGSENDETFEVAKSGFTVDLGRMSGEESQKRPVISESEGVVEEMEVESLPVSKEGLQDTIETASSCTTPVNEELTEREGTDGSIENETDAAQEKQVNDVTVEDAERENLTRIVDLKQLPSEDLADDSSDSTDEARLSSELETFLGDTPRSIGSNDSPRNHQARSQDPSSTEVQVSSSASERDRQTEANYEEPTPRSRKPVFERQVSEDRSAESVLDTVGANFDAFSEFHQNHVFDIVEIHKSSPEEILYDEEEQQEFYEECYQFQYNTRLRIRLEDIPEEGTLSKESTYLSHPFTGTDREETTFEKEHCVVETEVEKSTVGKPDSSLSDLDGETSVEVVVNDIVNCALVRASLSLMDEKTPNTAGGSS